MRKTIGPSLLWAVCCVGLGVLSILSTSSTAYVMTATTFVAFTIQMLIRLFLDGRVEQNRAAIELVFVVIGSIFAVEFALYIDTIGDQIYRLVNTLVFNKSSTSSFEERTRWTRIAFEAFVSSYGLGIGVGTARTSNGFVNIVASTGAAGAIFFAAFLVKLFVIKPRSATAHESYAAVLALLAPLVGLALSSTSPDFGPFTAVLFGLQSSRLVPVRPKIVVQQGARGDPDDHPGRRTVDTRGAHGSAQG
jgi:heme/copper-type cytochrome/quinol oxidase subunit 4